MFTARQNTTFTSTTDGITHINGYSQGRTELGRLITNFAHTPVEIWEKEFGSLEAAWHYYQTGLCHDDLCSLYGYNAYKASRKYPFVQAMTREVYIELFRAKLTQTLQLRKLLSESVLPLTHYYEYSGKVVWNEWLWIAEVWMEFRQELKDQMKISQRLTALGVVFDKPSSNVVTFEFQGVKYRYEPVGGFYEGEINIHTEELISRITNCEIAVANNS